MGKKNLCFFRICFTPIISSGKIHISRHHLDKYFNLELPKLRMYQVTKTLAADIAPHISYALRYLIVVFEKYLLYSSPKLVDTDPEGNLGL